MNKIVLNIGLLTFFLSLMFFSAQDLPVTDVLLRSFAIFVVVTLMSAVFVIVFFKAVSETISKKAIQKQESIMMGKESHE
jgi:membrane protein implicated in regulation of membrane protease activity